MSRTSAVAMSIQAVSALLMGGGPAGAAAGAAWAQATAGSAVRSAAGSPIRFRFRRTTVSKPLICNHPSTGCRLHPRQQISERLFLLSRTDVEALLHGHH